MRDATTTQEFEVGCYFDGAFGFEYNLRRILDFAEDLGFTPDLSLEIGEDLDFDVEEMDRAIEWLNDHCRTELGYAYESTFWGFMDGDFGLWENDDWE
tara:strand:+ start:1246 stop:1539 length:294 start_codon:yes stop_codon:yes gene_type:complete